MRKDKSVISRYIKDIFKEEEFNKEDVQNFIREDIRLDPVVIDKSMSIEQLLEFYMGKNTPDRQEFIINNLKVELDEEGGF